MVRLMIVDDDVIIRKGLAKNIAWEEHGFELVGTAGDGEAGYGLFAEYKPEIIISDIKMPFMDGLELSRKLLAESDKVKIILLTGYEAFEYAKQALELKVFDYILKPVDFDKLLVTVKKAAQELAVEKKANWRLDESKPLLQQRFWMNIIQGGYLSEEMARSEAAFIEIDLEAALYIVLLVKIDDYYNARIFAGVSDQEIIKSDIAALCRESMGNATGEVLSPGGDELVIIFGSQLKPGETTQMGLELGESIRQKINNGYRLAVTVGIGRANQGLSGIADSYREAKAAIEFRHIIGKNRVLTIGDTGVPVDNDLVDLPEYDEKLGLKVKMGLTAESIAIIDNIESKLRSQSYIPLATVRLMGMQLTILLLRDVEVGNPEETGSKNNLYFERCYRIQECQTIGEIFAELRQLVVEITEAVNLKRGSMQAVLVSAAIEYMENNYGKEGLSLSEVAAMIHVSPVYLSIMFKKERNINFSEYLTEIRIKQAMELLRRTDLKSYEVAEKVGYSNPQYFSVCFKKYSGHSPSDFKKQ